MRLLKGWLVSFSAVFAGLFTLIAAVYLLVPDKTLLNFVAQQIQEHSAYNVSFQQPASLSRTLRPTLRIADLEMRSKDDRVSFQSNDVLVQISLPGLLMGRIEFLNIHFGDYVVRVDETLPASHDLEEAEPEFRLPFRPVVQSASMRSLTVIRGQREYRIPVTRIGELKLELADQGDTNILSFNLDVMNEQMHFRIVLPSFYRIAYSTEYQASFSLTSPFFDMSGSGLVDRSTPAHGIHFELSANNPDPVRLAANNRQPAIPGDLIFRATLDGSDDKLALSVQQADWTGPEQSRAELEGRIDDVAGMSGVDLSISGDIVRAEWMTPYIPEQLGTLKKTAFSAVLSGGYPDLKIPSLSFTALSGEGLDVSLKGNGVIALDRDFPSILDADMKLAFSAPTTRAARLLLFDVIPEFGAIKGTADIHAADPPGNTVALDNIVINTRDKKGVKVDLKGSIAGFPLSDEPNSGYNLDVVMKSSSTAEFLKRMNLDAAMEGPMHLDYRIEGDTEALELNRIKLDAGDKKQLSLNATGNLGFGDWSSADPIKTINLELKGNSADTAAFARLAGAKLPELGALAFSAETRTISGKHRLENLLVHTTGRVPYKLKASGSASQFLLLPGLVIDGLQFKTRIYPAQAGNTGRPVNNERENRRSAIIDKPAGKGALAYLKDRANRGMKKPVPSRASPASPVNNVFLLTAKGKIETPYNEKPDIDLDLVASSDSTQQLAEVYNYHIPELGPLTAHGNVVTKAGIPGIPAANLRVGTVDKPVIKASGHIDNIGEIKGVEWTADLHLDSQSFGEMISLGNETVTAAPEDLNGELVLSDKDGTLGIDSFHLASKPSADLTVNIDGSYDDLGNPESMLLNSQIKARDLQVVAALFDRKWKKRGPVEFNTRVTHKKDHVLLLSQFTAGKSAMNADIRADFDKTPPRISGTIRGRNVYVPDYLEREKTDGKDNPENNKPVFSRKPLSLEFINNIDLDLTTEIESFDFENEEQIRSARFNLRIYKGTLSLKPMIIGFALGQLDLSMQIRSGKTPQFSFTADGRNINPWKDLAAYSDEETFFNSSADMDISLQSSGASPHEIAAGANGNIYMTLVNGRIPSMLLDALFVDVVGWVVNKATHREYDYFDCSIMDFDVNRGVLSTNALLLSNRRVAITGEGSIDLGKEEIDYTFLPKKNTKILSQADPVKLTGSLRDPKVTALPWKSAATTYGPLVFGPLIFAGTLAADYVAGSVIKHGRASPCQEYKKKREAQQTQTSP